MTTTARAAEVVVVGGGAVGLSIASELAREGVAGITVLDAEHAAPPASWAGAGIIAPAADRAGADPDAQLRTLSALLHATYHRFLREATGLDNGYRPCGGLEVARDAGQLAALDARAAAWAAQGIAHERLDGRGLARVEPALAGDLAGGYLLPGRAQIRNPWHLRALRVACERRGVRIEADTPVRGLDVRDGRVAAVRDGRVAAVRHDRGTLACGTLVVAAGAWSEGLLGPIGVAVPTPPVKGQIVLLRSAPGSLRRIIEDGPRYLVPRDDGRILVGATDESAGFDVRPTAGAVADLLAFAGRLSPALARAEVERTWAGLRPGNADGRPTIGRVPGFANLIVATGHRRAGLQLSTGTALLVADLLLGKPARIDLAPFRPGRPPGPPPRDLFHS
jgi:glycine oxidase